MELMRKDHPVISGKDESLAYYLTRHGLLEETIPLFSKSKLIRSAREGHDDADQSDLLKEVFEHIGKLDSFLWTKDLHLLVDLRQFIAELNLPEANPLEFLL